MDEFTSDEIPATGHEIHDPVFAGRPIPEELGLLAENRRLREQLERLTTALDTLQRANEGAYRELSMANGGARFDTEQPFPPDSPRRLGQLPRPFQLRRSL
ncbi:hypothetical protein ABZU94_10690 [Streptomyces mirabilis]|uniref:hypothetical protein n=1 Tax=Streptomyces sp. NPDC005388 TaxID=3156717 RepID=UPI0033B2496D